MLEDEACEVRERELLSGSGQMYRWQICRKQCVGSGHCMSRAASREGEQDERDERRGQTEESARVQGTSRSKGKLAARAGRVVPGRGEYME